MINFINPDKGKGIKWDLNLFLSGLLFTLMNFFPVNGAGGPDVVPQAIIVRAAERIPDGMSGMVCAGGTLMANVPVEIEFNCNAGSNNGERRYEWILAEEVNPDGPLLTREAERTVVRFERSGKYVVSLTVNEPGSGKGYRSEQITIVVNDPENPV